MNQLPAPAAADNARLVRRIVVVIAAVAVVLNLLAALIGGWDGLFGSMVGTLIVGVFFGIDVVLFRWTAIMPPLQVMAVVVMVYTFKVTLLAIFLVALRGTTAFSTLWFAVAAIALTSVVLLAAVVLVGRWKRLSVEPEPAAE